jgi:hypothetical protein
MLYTIRDITTENVQALVSNDVKLAWYPHDKDNTALAGSYLWTSQQIGDELPTAKGLDNVCDAFRFEKVPRRLVWLAMYGHGKSHLALAMANFFGQSVGSEPVEAVLKSLGRPERLVSFKEQRSRHLVLRLFGDDTASLSQAVVQGLEAALRETPETASDSLGLWFDPALDFLKDLDTAQLDKAGVFLKDHNLTVARLKAELAPGLRDDRHRELVHQLFAHLHKGVRPMFGADRNPGQLLTHAAKEFCGHDKPFCGILVLFDEFNVFLQKYAGDYSISGQGNPLQSLLDGVDTLREQAVFIAFTQYNPDLTAQKMLGSDTQGLTDLKKELSRLPANDRKRLASPLESILADYLRQDAQGKARWQELLMANPECAEELMAAIDQVPLLFPSRYNPNQQWNTERLTNILGNECFPLHPLTTALLCSATLRPSDTARPILGFVRKKMEQWNEQSALRPDGRLNWIYPVELAEYFGEMLAQNEDAWRRYVQTRENVGPEVEANSHQLVVKAMFVFEAAGLAAGNGLASFANSIASLSGLTLDESAALLQELTERGLIQRNEAAKKYNFWRLGEDGSKAQKRLDADIAQLRQDSVAAADTLRAALNRRPSRHIEIQLGNSQDWAAKEYVMPRALWSKQQLLSVLGRIELSPNKQELYDAPRGFFLRAVAGTDADVAWLQNHATDELEQALFELAPQNPPAIILTLPTQPQQGLMQRLLETEVLRGWGTATREEIGEQPYAQLANAVREQLEQEYNALYSQEKQLPNYQVPTVYQDRVDQLLGGNKHPLATAALKACYDATYRRYAPFLPDKTSGINFRKAVQRGCSFLLKGSFIQWHEEEEGREKSLFSNILKVSATSWGVVDAADQVSPPTLSQVKEAWDILDAAVPAGADRHSLREPLLTLLNAPYGYDFYALALLLCAWAGYHRHSVRFYNGHSGTPLTNSAWLGANRNMEQVVQHWLVDLDLRAHREDKGVLNTHIEALLTKLASGAPLLTEAEAAANYQELVDYAENETGDKQLRSQAREGAEVLANSLKLAEQAKQTVAQFEQKLGISNPLSPNGLRLTVDLLLDTRKPLNAGRIKPNAAAQLPALEKQVAAKLRTQTEQTCRMFENGKTDEKYGGNKEKLREIRDLLAKTGDDALPPLIASSVARLEKSYQDATADTKDAEFRSQLKEFAKRRNLADLLECVSLLETHQPHAESTAKLQENILAEVKKRIEDAHSWLQITYKRAMDVTTSSSAKKLADESRLAFARYECTPEEATRIALAEHCDRLVGLFAALDELKQKKPMDAKQLQKTMQRYDELLQIPHLSDAQQELVYSAQQKKQAKFEERAQAAEAKLVDFEVRHAAGIESAAELLTALQEAKQDGLRFLPLDSQKRMKPLETGLKKRIGEDATEEIALLFLRIDDPKQRKACLDKLSGLA